MDIKMLRFYPKILWKYDKKNTIILTVLKLMEGIMPIIGMLSITYIIDSFEMNIISKLNIIVGVGIYLISVFYVLYSMHLIEYIEDCLKCSLREGFKQMLTTKIATIEYKYIEDDKTSDLINRVMREPENRCVDAYTQTCGIIGLIINIVGVIFILASKVLWLPFVYILIAIPIMKLGMKSGKTSYTAHKNAEKYLRVADYWADILTNREAVEERTVFDYSEDANVFWNEQYENARTSRLSALKTWLFQSIMGGASATIVILLIIIVMVGQINDSGLTIGLFIAIVNNTIMIIPELSWTLPDYIKKFSENVEYIKDLDCLASLNGKMDYLEKQQKNSIVIESIEFKNLSFKYPNTEKYILKNINMRLDRGKHYAFVGANGAGKTTITKLLLGLYNDYEGEILINNKSLKLYTNDQIKAMYSVVYQDFVKYEISIRDNIKLGNPYINDDNTIYEVLDKMGLSDEIEQMKKGIDTTLGKLHKDSIDISGGQWQKLIMARALASTASVRILDEPTAALDPISESRLYDCYKEISRGITTIFISHRLASTKLADKIFVFDKGEIKEQGTHEKLIEIKGLYYKMFESQKEWYVNE